MLHVSILCSWIGTVKKDNQCMLINGQRKQVTEGLSGFRASSFCTNAATAGKSKVNNFIICSPMHNPMLYLSAPFQMGLDMMTSGTTGPHAYGGSVTCIADSLSSTITYPSFNNSYNSNSNFEG